MAQRAVPPAARGAEGMATSRVVVYPPDEDGGRRVRVEGKILGIAYSLRDVAECLRRAGPEGMDGADVASAT
ncbi:hypothetical protein RKD18_003472 [Streptomyces phaeoluteigriseus]